MTNEQVTIGEFKIELVRTTLHGAKFCVRISPGTMKIQSTSTPGVIRNKACEHYVHDFAHAIFQFKTFKRYAKIETGEIPSNFSGVRKLKTDF